jgi:hypothetical protein
MKEQTSPPDMQNRIILYTTADGKVTADVFFAHENFWLAQRAMAELFGVNSPAISKHLKNIYNSGELDQEATISKMETVQISKFCNTPVKFLMPWPPPRQVRNMKNTESIKTSNIYQILIVY